MFHVKRRTARLVREIRLARRSRPPVTVPDVSCHVPDLSATSPTSDATHDRAIATTAAPHRPPHRTDVARRHARAHPAAPFTLPRCRQTFARHNEAGDVRASRDPARAPK